MKKFNLFTMALAVMVLILSACKKESNNEPDPKPVNGTVTDICGNTYKTVKIGDQIWMAENMACTKYDTESELAGGEIVESDGKGSGYPPCYMDSRIREKWSDDGRHAKNMTDELLKKLGLLYNWAAAMGYATAEEAWNQTGLYDGNRQGICPNGWHLPSQLEWNTLENTVMTLCGEKSTKYVGKHLKSKAGWDTSEDIEGTDDFNFCALPAGGSGEGQIANVGGYTQIWTSTALSGRHQDEAFDNVITYNSNDVVAFDSLKENGRSVRCLKN